MGALVVGLHLLLFLFLATIPNGETNSHGIHNQIHLLRPQSDAGRSRIPGLSCQSWQLGVETHNIIGWATIPQECEGYVGHYMLGQQYRKDSKAVADEAIHYAESLNLARDGKDIWVFDIDETTLSNLPYFAQHGFGLEPYNPKLFDKWVNQGKAPALPESLRLYRKLLSLGIKPVFLTGRAEDKRNVTITNLKNAGYHTLEMLILKRPTYSGKTAAEYKSNERTNMEMKGYRIIGNIGDQWSDLLGTHVGNRTFKLPDPMYYIS